MLAGQRCVWYGIALWIAGCCRGEVAPSAASLRAAPNVDTSSPAEAAAAGETPRNARVVPPLPLADVALAGALATVAGDVAMHPVDTVKTIQQASGMSMFAAIRSISKGPNPISSFYDGVVPYCVADGLSGMVKFAAYETTKAWCEEHVQENLVPTARFVCAALAFVACSVILVPGELLKQRLQAGVYTGLGSGINTLLTKEGPRAMFTGYGATLFRDVPYTMLELGLYDLLKGFAQSTRRKLHDDPDRPSAQSDELLAAAATGGLVGFVTNPLDVIKTRMMTASKGALAGPLDATRILLRDSGPKGFFTGSAARVMWCAYLIGYCFAADGSPAGLCPSPPYTSVATSSRSAALLSFAPGLRTTT